MFTLLLSVQRMVEKQVLQIDPCLLPACLTITKMKTLLLFATCTFFPTIALIVDDFNNDKQYNSKHLNGLGGWTDDDGTMAEDKVSNGVLNLVARDGGYWYSSLGDCYDASQFNALRIRARAAQPAATFKVNVVDKSSGCGAGNKGKQSHRVNLNNYGALSNDWKDITIPFSDFGLNPSKLFSVAFESFSSGAQVSIDSIEFIFDDNPKPTPKPDLKMQGVAAWVYSKNATWLANIQDYDAKVARDQKMKYFFPYAGSVSIGKAGSNIFTLGYNSGAGSTVEYYHQNLPQSKMFPNIDSADGAAFKHWSIADMEEAAEKVAKAIIDDQKASGVHMDIEPFYIEHIPFYSKLRELLNKAEKQLTMFTGSSNKAEIIKSADIVVFSGYDRGTFATPWSPEEFGRSLDAGVRQLVGLADANGGHVLIGIPVLCSTTEFEYVSGGGCSHVSSGFKQHQYVQAAMDVLSNFHCRPSYLGAAFWGFTTNTKWGHQKCTFHRKDVSVQTWNVLKNTAMPECA